MNTVVGECKCGAKAVESCWGGGPKCESCGLDVETCERLKVCNAGCF